MKVKLDKNNKSDETKKRIKKAKEKYVKDNKKISESKKKIQEDKDKTKIEKNGKLEKFSKTKLGCFFAKVGSFFKVNKDNYSFNEVMISTIISLIAGCFISSFVFIMLSGGRNYFVLSKDLDKFVEVYETLKNNYYGDVDKELLVEEAIKGMTASVGDIYTNYSDSNNASEFNELVDGVYEGIGCTIQLQEQGVVVIEVFDNGPAFKSGILPGDVIISVNDKDEIFEYYLDVTDGMELREGIPYYNDLYLDIIYYNQNKKMINYKMEDIDKNLVMLDESELKDALNEKIITKEQYEKAYKVAYNLMDEIESGTNIFINRGLKDYLEIKA